MFFRKVGLFLFLGVLAMMAGCNSEAEEFESFEEQIDKLVKSEEKIEEVEKHIQNGEPEEALDVLKKKVIPEKEELLQEYEDLDYDSEDVNTLNQAFTQHLQAELDRQNALKKTYEKVLEYQADGQLENADFDNELNDLYEKNEALADAFNESRQTVKKITDQNDQFEMDEEKISSEEEMNAPQLNELTEAAVATFIGLALESDSAGVDDEETETASQVENDEKNNTRNKKDQSMLLDDQGNPEVALVAEAEFKDNNFYLEGQSNLLEGSTIQMKTYQFGTENPYFKEKLEVDKDGNFGVELEGEEADLEGDPMEIRLAYMPDHEDEEAKDIYGEEGENLEGEFVQKYTNIKRTRNAIVAYTDMEMKNGAETEFLSQEWDKPDDYGDTNIWMEKEKVETKDHYYVITMNSNLNELTRINAEAEVPGYETAGYTSRTKVRPDGSFRLHLPRPDVDDAEIVVVFEATSDAAIETEELYGEHGENFEGDLVEKTKRGQKIEYELELGDDS